MIRFFDANCMYGTRCLVREGSVVTDDEYQELFNRARIDKVLAYHSDGINSDLYIGNELIAELQRQNKRYVGQWTVMPSVTKEFYSTDELLCKMKDNVIKTVRMFPIALSFPILPYGCNELYSAFEAFKIPLFIDHSQVTYSDLYEVLKAYPNMPVVLCGAGYRTERQIYPLVAACSNLYIETSLYVANNSIEMFVKQFGAEKLIFGTGVPNSSACGAVCTIQYACISEEEKQKIAAENLENLLAEVKL